MSDQSHTSGYPPAERHEYGVTATIVDTATGAVRVEVVRGDLTSIDATRVVAQMCDDLGPTWRVRTLSHPLSILNDLRNGGQERKLCVESSFLGRIGRPDLIEHRAKYAGLRTATDYARRRKDGR